MVYIILYFLSYPCLWMSSHGLAVMHLTKTNMVLGSRHTACHWGHQEGHPVLNARARTKVLSEAPSKPQGTGGNGGKIEETLVCGHYNFNRSYPSTLAWNQLLYPYHFPKHSLLLVVCDYHHITNRYHRLFSFIVWLAEFYNFQ